MVPPARATFETALELSAGETRLYPHLVVKTVFHTDVGIVGFSAERDEAAAARAAAAAAAAAAEAEGESSGGDDGGPAAEKQLEQQQEEEEEEGGDGGGSSSTTSSSSSASSSREEDADDADADADADDADAAVDPSADEEAAAMAAMGLPLSFGGGGGGRGDAADDGDDDGGANQTTKKKKKKKKRCWRPPLAVRCARIASAAAAAAAAGKNWVPGGDDLSLRLREELAEDPRAQALLRGLGLWEEEEEEEEEEGEEEEGGGGGGDEAPKKHHHHHHHHHHRHRHHVKYWLQRYSLFSRYDAGVRLDVEGWYSVTPECVALWQARRALAVVRGADRGASVVALDAFAGCGGNTIALRRALDDPELGKEPSLPLQGEEEEEAKAAAPPPPPPPSGSNDDNSSSNNNHRVVAVELDRARLRMAQSNARVYGLPPDSIEWMRGDFFRACATSAADVVLFSPPWGGPAYRGRGAVFGLPAQHLPGIGRTLGELLDFGRRIVQRRLELRRREEEGKEEKKKGRRPRGVVVAFLPRNTGFHATAQLAAAACGGGGGGEWGTAGGEWQVERNVLNGHLKGVTLYCPVGAI